MTITAEEVRVEMVPIQRIRVDEGIQTRKFMRPDIINEYAEEYTNGTKLPPIVLFDTGDKLVLAGGFHRFEAQVKLKFAEVEAEIRTGTLLDALIFAAGSNSAHGLRRTREDKINAVTMLLQKPEIASQSNRAIAEMAHVSDPFVGTVRDMLIPPTANASSNGETAATDQPPPTTETRTGKDGKQRRVKKKPKKKKGAVAQAAQATQGEAAFDMKQFNSDMGTLLRHLDRLARDFGLVHPKSNTIKETTEHQGIRRKLTEIQKDVSEWRKKLEKDKKDAEKEAKQNAKKQQEQAAKP